MCLKICHHFFYLTTPMNNQLIFNSFLVHNIQKKRYQKITSLPCSPYLKQEAQLMLTNPRAAFRGQSRSPNIAQLFHMLGIVFSCAIVSNFVFKTRRFSNIRLQKCRDFENRVRVPSRSLEITPFDRAHMTSY